MYGPQLKQKTIMDVTRAKKKVNSLNEDNMNQVRKISVEQDLSLEYVAFWVNSGLSQLNSGFEKVKDDSKKTVTHASTTTKKILGNGLSQYNAQAAEVVNKLPGSVGVKAREYPWVSISFALIAGIFVRVFLMSRRN
ncbi:MAG TPA: hypothetical protein VK856_02265 [Anaerolineaceae bacterium]|nr:hypothetical protein [Anaerolineaceae bacterium]